jgi:hypothetical protein
MSKTTVKQLLTDIDRRYPNTYSDEDKIDWINQSLQEVYKDLALEEFYKFNTIKGERIYNLPTNCTIDMIKNVQMSINPVNLGNGEKNYRTLKNATNNETMNIPSYYAGIDETTIGIYPCPEDVYSVNVYYGKTPDFVSKESDFVDINNRYINLIKYNVLSIICMSGNNPDIEVANQYILLYNNLVNEVLQSKYEDRQKYYVIRDELRPRTSYRRRY